MASFRKTKSGKWQATVLLPNGKRRSYSHPMKKAVKSWARDIESKRDAGDLIPDRRAGRVTLSDWWVKWEATRTWEKSTRGTNTSAWRLHIQPHLGDVPVAAITRLDIDEWVVKLNQPDYIPAAGDKPPRPLGRRTQQIAVNVLSGMLGGAMREGLRRDNPCAGMKRPRHEAAEPLFLTRTEAMTLLGKMDDPGMASVMLFCGLRWSEAAALKGDAIDWFRDQLVVKRALTRAGIRDYGKSSTSRRVVPLYPELKEALAARLDGRERDDLLFLNKDGRVWEYSNWRRTVFNPARDAAKLTGLVPHELRHTYGSWLAEAGVDLYRIQTLMGHATPRMTMRYARFRPDAFGSAADVMRQIGAHPVRSDETPQIESGKPDTA